MYEKDAICQNLGKNFREKLTNVDLAKQVKKLTSFVKTIWWHEFVADFRENFSFRPVFCENICESENIYFHKTFRENIW